MNEPKYQVGAVVLCDNEEATVREVRAVASGFEYDLTYNSMSIIVAVNVREDELVEMELQL